MKISSVLYRKLKNILTQAEMGVKQFLEWSENLYNAGWVIIKCREDRLVAKPTENSNIHIDLSRHSGGNFLVMIGTGQQCLVSQGEKTVSDAVYICVENFLDEVLKFTPPRDSNGWVSTDDAYPDGFEKRCMVWPSDKIGLHLSGSGPFFSVDVGNGQFESVEQKFWLDYKKPENEEEN